MWLWVHWHISEILSCLIPKIELAILMVDMSGKDILSEEGFLLKLKGQKIPGNSNTGQDMREYKFILSSWRLIYKLVKEWY